MSWKNFGVIREIHRNSGEFLVQWKISHFSSLSGQGTDCYWSPDFVFADAEWHLVMYPHGIPKDYIRFYLERIDSGPTVKNIQFILGIEGAKGGVEMRRKGEHDFTFNGFASFDFLSRQLLRDHLSVFLPNDQLTVICSVKRVVPSPTTDASIQTEEFREDKALTEENQFPSEKRSLEKVVEDISLLLKSGEHSDTTVQVGDVEFKVHRVILSARSPVLSAMLLHETAEKVSNRIVIEDCQPDVFGEYLQYLYSGSVRSLSEIDVFALFRVADKYLADDLKRQCLEHIRDTLNVQTFCDTVKLALVHGESGLLQFAIEFATGNIRSIIRSVEWQNFLRDYHREANEILIKSLGPPE